MAQFLLPVFTRHLYSSSSKGRLRSLPLELRLTWVIGFGPKECEQKQWYAGSEANGCKVLLLFCLSSSPGHHLKKTRCVQSASLWQAREDPGALLKGYTVSLLLSFPS